jgi:hypothetical protein
VAAELVPRACGIVRIEVKGRNTMCKTALAFIRRGIVSFYFLLEMTLPSRSSAETSWVPEILSTLWATKKLELITSVITLILIGVFLKKLAEGLADYIKQATTWTTSRFSDRAFFHRRFYQKFVAVLDEETRKWQFSHGRPFDMDSFYIRVRLTSLPAFFVNIDASASDWEQTWTQRRNEPRLEPREALNKYQRLAVIGQPGIGKTTLLRYLSYLYAFDKAADPVDDGRTSFWTRWIWPLSRPSQQDRKAVGSARLDSHQKERRSRHHVHYGWRSGHRVPIYISLKELTLVSDFVAYLPIYFERHNFPKAKRFIEKKLRAGEFVFLLDALDEVEEYKEFIRITNFRTSPLSQNARR